ncbi:MAG TPA: group II intron reverse transcriptase/maturase [Chitinophagaceae bacterium]|nr:group II intron reverse transcriptase/maturase [Chitinophagaceae bacterium]
MKLDEAPKSEMITPKGRSTRNVLGPLLGAESDTATDGQTKAETLLIEQLVERSNMMRAYQRVLANKGAPGVDGLSVGELKGWLKLHWASIKAALLAGAYQPQAVRLVELPKADGGVRRLGIPTVVDRLLQQALLQVLQPHFEPEFSESSYGFRPGRNAGQAVRAAQAYVQSGRRIVVDIDLETFFDRVNHDIVMSRVARKVKDKRVLKLIRRYLTAGLMKDGIVSPRVEGTPQGGPLSPLLSNILLTDLDRELERRGHCFCRYADDCNIYVGSVKAGKQLFTQLTKYLSKVLKLKVNEEKSAVDRAWRRKFLGYSLSWHKRVKLQIAGQSVKKLKAKIRAELAGRRFEKLERVINRLNPILRGWMTYYRYSEIKGLQLELDGWIRRKLRCLLWRQWKQPSTRARELRKRGVAQKEIRPATRNRRGPWWNAGASHMNQALPKRFFDQMGLVSLVDTWQSLQRD